MDTLNLKEKKITNEHLYFGIREYMYLYMLQVQYC